MRRQASKDHGILLSYIINMIFHAEWAAIALICFGLSKWVNFPSLIWQIALAVWFIWPAIITFVLGAMLAHTNDDQPPKPNINPYSAKNSTFNSKQDNQERAD